MELFAADGHDAGGCERVTGKSGMRPFQIGQVPIEKIWINPKSRDDIPAVLKGLQYIWSDEKLRARLFALLDEHIVPETDRTVGRPGMELWQVLVLGVLKQGLGCDFDRLHDLANHHEDDTRVPGAQ